MTLSTQSKLQALLTDGYEVKISMLKSHFHIYVHIVGNWNTEHSTTKPTLGEAIGDIFRQIKGV